MTDTPANRYAPCDGILRLLCVNHPEDIKKSDAYIFSLDGNVLLCDGGMSGTRNALDSLLELRRSMLAGHPEPADGDCRLHLTWVLSHRHIDHAGAVLETLLPCPLLAFDRVYLPPETAAVPHRAKAGVIKDELIMQALDTYCPGAPVVRIGCASDGETPRAVEFGAAEAVIYPPDGDWSAGERRDIVADVYYEGDRDHPKIITAVVNACSTWLCVSYAGRKILLTGDSMKNTDTVGNENFDRMCGLWRARIGKTDFIKWPHHGLKRDAAADGVLSFEPEYILTSTLSETASAVTAEKYPGCTAQFCDCSARAVTVTVTPDGRLAVSQ